MNLEQTLTDELASVAATLDVPPPPHTAAVVQQAAQSRQRTRLRWTATTLLTAAAVVAAVVAGTQLGHPDATPQPTRPTPTGSSRPLPTGQPLRTYVDPDRRTLYLDGVLQPGSWTGATTHGGTTIGYVGEPGQGAVAILRGTDRVGTVRHVVDDKLVTSPSGRTLAWIESYGGSVQLVVAEVTPGSLHELGRERLDPVVLKSDSEAAEQVISVDDAHTVVYGGVSGGHSWAPGRGPETADISVYLTRPHGFPNSFYPPQLNPAGTWGAWPSDRDGRSHRDDSQVPFPAITVQRANHPETRFTFARPASEGPLEWEYWETDEDLILAEPGHASRPTTYLRCNVLSDRCEVAPTPGSR